MHARLFLRLTMLPLALSAASAAVTFHKDVEPVLQARCQGCHRPGEAAPMSFLTYTTTRPFAKAIRAAVLAKKMPPWFADAPHGTFANDPSLTPKEIETLVAWADSGAAAGNPTDAPPPLRFVEGWSIGKPDTVIEMPAAYKVPATGVIATAGCQVRLFDANPAQLPGAMDTIENGRFGLRRAVDRGKISPDDLRATLARIRTVATLAEAVADAGLTV